MHLCVNIHSLPCEKLPRVHYRVLSFPSAYTWIFWRNSICMLMLCIRERLNNKQGYLLHPRRFKMEEITLSLWIQVKGTGKAFDFSFFKLKETNSSIPSQCCVLKSWTKLTVVYLLQSQQAPTILLAGAEGELGLGWEGGGVAEKRCCLILDGAECSWTQGSPRCFTVVLTFKSSQGSRAEALKNNQFPSLLLTLLTLDHYHCGTLRQLGMHDVYRAGTMHVQTEKTEKGFHLHAHTHKPGKHVWAQMQTQSRLSEERTKALSL